MRYVLSLPEPIIKGNHCETSAIKRVFDYYNQGYSEQMLFGLGGGIGFIYLSDKSMLVPFIGTKNGRVGNAVRGVAELLSLELDVKETESKKKAFENVLNDLKENRPVIINVDMALLPYTGVPANEHFGGHAIALFGIDQECNEAYIYDRGKHVVVERLDALIEARSSDFAPFRPHNRSFHFKG
ncbi:MAG: BtrH N-terminal domain-containing protein, partial [Bacillota bacterium]